MQTITTQAYYVTTDDAEVVLFSFSIPPDSCVRTQGIVIGFETSADDALTVLIDRSFRRTGDGPAFSVGTPTYSKQSYLSGASWSVTTNASADSIEVRVSGGIGHTINWNITGFAHISTLRS